MCIAAAIAFLWVAGVPLFVVVHSVLTPENAEFGLIQAVILFTVSLVFGFLGTKRPVKAILPAAGVFAVVWLMATFVLARFAEIDMIALPVILAITASLIIAHFVKLWTIDGELTCKIVSLSSTGNLVSGHAPEVRVETGLRLLETIFPVSELIVFELNSDGSLVPVGRARKEGGGSSAVKRNESWQETVSQCEEALAQRKTVLQRSEYQENAARLAVPLNCDDEIIGVLFVDIKDGYESDDKILLESFAGQLARNFQRDELRKKNLPHSSWWSTFSTQSNENRVNVASLMDGIIKEKSFGELATAHLEEAHAVVYLDGTIAYINKKMCELAGISENEIAAVNLFNLLDQFKTLVFNDPSLAIRRVLQTGKTYSGELDFEDRDSILKLQIIPVKFPAAAELSGLEESAEKPACLLITLQNIDDKKENERLRSDMANLMSHELRTPITSINGFAEMLLMDGEIPEDAREYLSIIASESQRASALLSNFLSVANLEQSDKKEVDKVPVKVDKIVREIVDDYNDVAKRKRIRIVEKQSEYIPPVSADRGLITKAISHLVDNAIKYSPERTSVIISTILESDFLKVVVEDRGYGIPKGEQQKIWQKFYRVARDGQSKEEESTGLGLSLVKEIVEQHNGEVDLDSAVGKGSRFSVKLPRL